jgi:hypothetical protein
MDMKQEIKDTIGILSHNLKPIPKWETPEQYFERTLMEWPDDSAVYIKWYNKKNIHLKNHWACMRYSLAKYYVRKKVHGDGTIHIIRAGEAGIPPNDWEPEE